MNTLQQPTRPLRRYAIDKHVQATYTNHNGHSKTLSYWQEICELDATRASNAARVAESKWKGTFRVRLLSAPTKEGGNIFTTQEQACADYDRHLTKQINEARMKGGAR